MIYDCPHIEATTATSKRLKIIIMKISQIAQKVRAILKKNGVDPKGKVSCLNNDYVSEITVNLGWVDDDTRDAIESAIGEYDQDDFTWNVM